MRILENANGAEPSGPVSQLSRDWFSADLLEILPAAVYVCNADAVVVAYSRRATELWGRAPSAGDTDKKYCGAHKLFRPDGTFLPHSETPMEWVLRTGKPALPIDSLFGVSIEPSDDPRPQLNSGVIGFVNAANVVTINSHSRSRG